MSSVSNVYWIAPQEHVEQHEEDEEDVDEEVDGAEQRRGALDVAKVEVAEDHAEQGEDGVHERPEVMHLFGDI